MFPCVFLSEPSTTTLTSRARVNRHFNEENKSLFSTLPLSILCFYKPTHVHANKIAIFQLLYSIPSSYMVYYRCKQAHGSTAYCLPLSKLLLYPSGFKRHVYRPLSSICPPFTGAGPLNSPPPHTQEQTSNRQEDVRLYEP